MPRTVFHSYKVWYATTDRDKTQTKTFRHDGSLLENQRVLSEAKNFANLQYEARIDLIIQIIVVGTAGHGKPSGLPTLQEIAESMRKARET